MGRYVPKGFCSCLGLRIALTDIESLFLAYFLQLGILGGISRIYECWNGIVMWAMPTNYGADPAPPRYFIRKREEPKDEVAKESVKTNKPGLDWRQFVVILMRALVPFPEARDAVKAAFWAAGAETSP